jgi:hypothetical protein
MQQASFNHSCRSLEKLNLFIGIGNAGCEAIATLVKVSSSNIEKLGLTSNNIDNEGVRFLVDSLIGNTRLKNISLTNSYTPIHGNLVDRCIVDNDFSSVLCNTSSINSIYSSNHTLEALTLPRNIALRTLKLLLNWNKGTNNKSHVAIRKILKCHPNIDMEPSLPIGFPKMNKL